MNERERAFIWKLESILTRLKLLKDAIKYRCLNGFPGSETLKDRRKKRYCDYIFVGLVFKMAEVASETYIFIRISLVGESAGVQKVFPL